MKKIPAGLHVKAAAAASSLTAIILVVGAGRKF